MRNKNKITEEIKSIVRKQLREEKRVVVKERLTAVNMYMNGMTQESVAKSLGRNRGFVWTALKNYLGKGLKGLEEQRGGDRRSELTIEQRQELGYIINNTCPINAKGWDGNIIVELIEHKYGVKYSRESVYHILRKLNITYKKAKKVDPKKSEQKIKAWKEVLKKTQ
jgi:transposase